jgi:hypothetical protein
MKRRICWPNPDATCLEGGCCYCPDERPRSVNVIYKYVRRAGTVRNRGNAKMVDAVAAFEYGETHGAGR